jgi:hypothetical protein
MNRYITGAALLGALALTGSTVAVAQPQSHPNQCFYSNDWGNWKAPDAHTMYIQVSGKRVFRLDFASSCQMMTYPSAHLITVFRGGNSICSPLDIDLKVSDGGIPESCLVSKMTQLSPAEAAAIPQKDRP